MTKHTGKLVWMSVDGHGCVESTEGRAYFFHFVQGASNPFVKGAPKVGGQVLFEIAGGRKSPVIHSIQSAGG